MDLTALTDEELDALRVDVLAERERRLTLTDAPAQTEALARKYLAAEGATEGQEWRRPAGAHNAYPEGWVVTHGDRMWVSLTRANVWEPGVSGWREVVTDEDGAPTDAPAGYQQPTGGHDAYSVGDRVTFEGTVYESVIDGNVWSPTAHPAGWQRID